MAEEEIEISINDSQRVLNFPSDEDTDGQMKNMSETESEEESELPSHVDEAYAASNTSRRSSEYAFQEDEDKDAGVTTFDRLSYALAVTSNVFFLIASALYVWVAVRGLAWERKAKDIPDYVLEADDDYTWQGWLVDDDYVFPAGQTWVSQYQIVYGVAALCFVPGFLGVFMILAGAFGVASACMVEKDLRLANIFNLVSVHLFAVEAAGLLFGRNVFGGVKFWFHLSDSFFVIGTLIDVALGYVYYFSAVTIPLAKLGIAAACLWLTCAAIHLGINIYLKKHGTYHKEGFENPFHRHSTPYDAGESFSRDTLDEV